MALKDTEGRNRTIVLNFSKSEYSMFMSKASIAREMLDCFYDLYPELFPSGFGDGYKMNGLTRRSVKLGLQMRKICCKRVSYRIRPSFVLPYMRGETESVSKPLFLLRFGVPFWALAHVFGRDAMYWYRTFLRLSNYSLVGTTIHQQTALPEDLLADEHHVRINGKKAYIATTVSQGCILGVEATNSFSEEALLKAYDVFKTEAQRLKPGYMPKTVNADGWWATQNAWRRLFPKVAVVECFLHAFLKVRERVTKKLRKTFENAAEKTWNCYRANTKRQMAQRLRRLREYSTQIQDSPMKTMLLKLTTKRHKWLKHIEYPSAYRTSNQLDRVMKFMNRHAHNSQMFHSDIAQTSKNFRAFALIYNFSPYSPQARIHQKELNSPAARLNGFTYHENWLQNLLIAASIGGSG